MSVNAFAIKTDGTLWGWGYNVNGTVGDGTATTKSSPVQIGALTNWSKVAAGNETSIALKTDGTLWSWGRGLYGTNATNSIINYSSPVQVGSLNSWIYISKGNAQFFAIAETS